MRALIQVSCLAFLSPALLLADGAPDRLKDASEVLSEIMATPDKSIPRDLLERAHCIVIVPGAKAAAFVVGGKYGRGFAMCRKTTDAGWGPPAAVRMEGGSVGFQIGGSSTDIVMLVMNERGMKRLLESQFTLGGNASVAAGPVGRTATAETDAYLAAEILSWSRAKGLFAGVALQGATLRNDLAENRELYGQRLENKDILLTDRTPPPAASQLVASLNSFSSHEQK